MGDGSYQNGGLHLATYAFTPSDIALLTDALTNNFGVQCTIHKHVRGPRIYINKASMDTLRDSLKSHMVPSMHYKIGI